MAIREKKKLLQRMYQPAPGSEAVPDAPATPAKAEPRSERQIDRTVAGIAFTAMWCLILAGSGAVAWMVWHDYAAGANLRAGLVASDYVRDFLRLGGLELFFAALVTGIFILFREALPRGWRLAALIVALILIPVGPVATFFMPAVYDAGRNVAFARLDLTQLVKDAQAYVATMKQVQNDPTTVDSADTEYGDLPLYTRQTVAPRSVEVYPHGLRLFIGSSGGWTGQETLDVPTGPLTPAQESAAAGSRGSEVIGRGSVGGLVPVFRGWSIFAPDELTDPAQPPATMPRYRSPY